MNGRQESYRKKAKTSTATSRGETARTGTVHRNSNILSDHDTSLHSSQQLHRNHSDIRVDVPTLVDIVLGRGKPYQSHPGNRQMLQIVDEHKVQYQRADRKAKKKIIEEVLRIIWENGARFLSKVHYENSWVEVSYSIAYRKIGHAFRCKARGALAPESSTTAAAAMCRQNQPTNPNEGPAGLVPSRALQAVREALPAERGILGDVNADPRHLLLNNQILGFEELSRVARSPIVPPVPYQILQHPAAIGLRHELDLLNRLGSTRDLRMGALPEASPMLPSLYQYHLPGGVLHNDFTMGGLLARSSQVMEPLSSPTRTQASDIFDALRREGTTQQQQHPRFP